MSHGAGQAPQSADGSILDAFGQLSVSAETTDAFGQDIPADDGDGFADFAAFGEDTGRFVLREGIESGCYRNPPVLCGWIIRGLTRCHRCRCRLAFCSQHAMASTNTATTNTGSPTFEADFADAFSTPEPGSTSEDAFGSSVGFDGAKKDEVKDDGGASKFNSANFWGRPADLILDDEDEADGPKEGGEEETKQGKSLRSHDSTEF